MRQKRKTFSILLPMQFLLLAAFLLWAPEAAAIDFTDTERNKLKAGKTVHQPLANSGQKGFYGGTSYVLIDAPIDAVWEAIHDFSAYKDMFVATTSVEEVAKKGDTSLIHYQMGNKVIQIEYYVNIAGDPDKYTMTFNLVENKPHDILMIKGYWRLFPQKSGKTLVAYVISAQIPMGLVNLFKDSWHSAVERNIVGAPAGVKKLLTGPNGKKYLLPKKKR